MAHPDGGRGPQHPVSGGFPRAFQSVARGRKAFRSTTGESMTASPGLARDGRTAVLILKGKQSVCGRVCGACWGFARSCTGERIGHAVPQLALTSAQPRKSR